MEQKSNGRHFVSCVLACGWPPNKSYKWKDTTALMNHGKREYNEKKIIASGTKFQIEIPNGTKKKINVGVSEGYTTLISDERLRHMWNISDEEWKIIDSKII